MKFEITQISDFSFLSSSFSFPSLRIASLLSTFRSLAQERSGPVQFEKDTPSSSKAGGDASAFGIDQFLDEAKRGTKRAGLDESS